MGHENYHEGKFEHPCKNEWKDNGLKIKTESWSAKRLSFRLKILMTGNDGTHNQAHSGKEGKTDEASDTSVSESVEQDVQNVLSKRKA